MSLARWPSPGTLIPQGSISMSIYHKHHIVPRHMGGSDDPSNLIELTVEEHAEAHLRLWEEHGKTQDLIAYQGLSGMINKAEIISQVSSNARKEKWKDPEYRAKKSNQSKEAALRMWKDDSFRTLITTNITDAVRSKWDDPAYRARRSAQIAESNKNRWANPEFRSKMTPKMKAIGKGEKPSS